MVWSDVPSFRVVANLVEAEISHTFLLYTGSQMEKNDNDIHRIDDEIYHELLAVATDNEALLVASPKYYRRKVIRNMTSLIMAAKQDPTIRQYFFLTGRNPDMMLDQFLRKAVAKLGK